MKKFILGLLICLGSVFAESRVGNFEELRTLFNTVINGTLKITTIANDVDNIVNERGCVYVMGQVIIIGSMVKNATD